MVASKTEMSIPILLPVDSDDIINFMNIKSEPMIVDPPNKGHKRNNLSVEDAL